MKEQLTKERLVKNIDHFYDTPPSQWNATTVIQLKTVLRLIKCFLNGEVVMVTTQKEPKTVEEIFPESEGWKGSATAGLNNATSVSPDETASQQLEDKLSQ